MNCFGGKKTRVGGLLVFVFGTIIIPQFTLAQDDAVGASVGRNENSISGKFFEYMRNLNPSSTSDPVLDSTKANENGTLPLYRRIFLDNASFQEAYQRLIDRVKKVREMFSTSNSSGIDAETDPTPSTDTGSSSSSNRTGRLNPSSWTWTPWGISNSPTPIPTSDTTPRSRNPFNRLFLGPFDRNRDGSGGSTAGTEYSDFYSPRNSYYPGVASSPYGPGSSSNQNQYNYVYNSKPNSATDLQQHTTTTIYILCVCIALMIIGSILFAIVTKCQERARNRRSGANATNVRRGRRRGSSSATLTTACGSAGGDTPPQISIVMGPDGAPPAYPKVIYDPPPPYDTLFPDTKV